MHQQPQNPTQLNPDQQNNQLQNQQDQQSDYGSASYWQNRYIKTKGQRFDWLQNYSTLQKLIIKYIGQDDVQNKKILNIGCGNGQIQDYIYDAGYKNIYNNDISKTVIEQMNKIKQQKQQKQMIYEVMDVTNMAYEDNYFDLVLDKSTIDALLCSENPYLNTAKMMEEVWRVLKNGGIYLVISYSSPESRNKHFIRPHIAFDMDVQQLVRLNEKGDKLLHYAYICRKKEIKSLFITAEWKKQFYDKLKIEEDQYYNS